MKIFFITAFVVTILLSSCSKEIKNTSLNEQTSLSSRASTALINNEKQERNILFVSNRDGNDEIYAMNLDGSNIVRLTFNGVPDGRASWSANGQHITFASGVVGLRDIYVMNANGSGLQNITNTPNVDEDFPEWSPNGNHVVFSSNRDGNHEIYVTNLDGDNVKRRHSG